MVLAFLWSKSTLLLPYLDPTTDITCLAGDSSSTSTPMTLDENTLCLSMTETETMITVRKNASAAR